MTYEEASGFWETSQTDFEYDEAMCAAMPEPSMGKIKAKKVHTLIYKYIVGKIIYRMGGGWLG